VSEPNEPDFMEDGELPFDDPVARTRMAWLRTMLIVAVIGLLMWRSAYINGQEWWSLAWIIPSALMLGIGLTRVRGLTRYGTGESRVAPLAWTTGGFLTLAAVGMLLAVV
jgi:hypothetical protein